MRYSDIFNESYLTPESYDKLEVIEACHDAILEGVFDNRVVKTASTYTYSMIIELLNNVKEKLLKLCSVVLSYLNNYILNSAKLIDKYREVLKDKVSKLKELFSYSYYEYPDAKGYPDVLRATDWTESHIRKLQDTIRKNNWTSDEVHNSVDAILREFSSKALGREVDVYDIENSTKKIVLDNVQGKLVVKFLTYDDIDSFIALFKTYRPLMDEIKRTKTAVEKDYNALKVAYEKAIKMPAETKGISNLEMAYDPEKAAFKAHEAQRFADIKIEMTRMFNGFITIYNKAFETKLDCIKERVDRNKVIIHELLMRTGLVAALNTKNPDKNKKPFEWTPKVKD